MNFLLITCFIGLALAEEPITRFYHDTIGIKQAAFIKAAEEATDFDGARIVGGSAATIGRFSHFGGVIITLTSGATSICGSSLITNSRSITAAQCWWDGRNQARQFVLVFGSLTMFAGGTRITTTNVQFHASFNPNNLNNNIAICVHNQVGFNNNIRNIALPPNSMLNNNFVGTWGWAVGFGRQSDSVTGIPPAQRLHHVQLQVISNAECAAVFGNSVVTASTLCTSGVNGRSICGGDSGGPFELTSGSTFLAGIASFFHERGCQLGYPAGFTRVPSYIAWIQSRL